MKRFKTIIAILLLLTLIPAVLFGTSACLPRVYDETYYAELSDMVARLKSAEGNRLILVGNSDVAFGTDGALLESLLKEKGYDYTVCPLGLYGAVGTSAMLDLCKSELRKGDTVVLIVEPISSTLTTYFGAEAYWKCAESDKSLLLPLSGERKAALAGSYTSYLQQRYTFSQSGEKPVAEEVYRKSAFNDRCDLIYERNGNIMPLGYDTAVPIDYAAVMIEDAFADEVNAFIQKANAKGASVVVSFSPMNRSAIVDPSDEAAETFFTMVNETFRCPVVSDPNRYILDSGWFYDSNVHLNSAGARVRTALLAEDLLSYWGCTSPVVYDMPEMPLPVVSPVETTEGDADAFLFTPIADGAGYLVSGLNETGKRSASLAVPSFCEGRPVVGFTADALAGASALVELTLPAEIESLPDGLFDHTPNLLRLNLLHRTTLPAVSEHAFDRLPQCKVFVPQQDYPLYRDGVGCAQNPWEPHLDRIVTY